MKAIEFLFALVLAVLLIQPVCICYGQEDPFADDPAPAAEPAPAPAEEPAPADDSAGDADSADEAGDSSEDTAEEDEPVYEESSEVADEAPAPSTSKVSLGHGGYFSLLKLIFLTVLYLLWVKTADWLSIDAVEYEKNWRKWNPIYVGAFMGSLILTLALPWFWLGYIIMILAYIIPFVMYVRYRNEDMNPADKVFTPAHLRHVFSESVGKIGVKVAAEKADQHTVGSPVVLMSECASERQREIRKVQAHAHEGFLEARKLFATIMANHPESVMLDFTAAGVSVRSLLDGVWHPGESMERETADQALEALKILCGMNPQDRKSRQEGTCKVEFTYTFNFPEERLKVKLLQEAYDAIVEEDDDEKYMEKRKLREDLRKAKDAVPEPITKVRKSIATVSCQGTATGERVLIEFSGIKQDFKKMSDVGMRDKMGEELVATFEKEKGIVLFSAPAGQGLSTTLNLALDKTDRFQREYYALEREDLPHEKVENITIVPYAQGDNMRETLKRFFLKEPQVAVIQDMTAPIMEYLFREMKDDDRLIVTTTKAKDASEAILRILMLKDDDGNTVSQDELANYLTVVYCQRLVRKLCDHCKQRVQAPPALAAQLGFPAGNPVFLYQPKTLPLPEGEEVCPECHGIGYRGRTAVTEMLVVGPTVQEVIRKMPKLDLLRKAAKKDGNRSMLEEGIVLLAKGTTSLAELKRILES